MRRQLLAISIITLLLGGLIYLLFRSTSLIMFVWIDRFWFFNRVFEIRAAISESGLRIPDWILYALPDGLWLFSYMTFAFYLWKCHVTRENAVWFISIPIMAILSEMGQFIAIVPGTFDLADLAMYGIGTTLPFIIYNYKITLNNKIK